MEYTVSPQSPVALNIYYCGHEQCAPGHFFGPAARQHYLMHCVLKGAGIYRAGGQESPVTAGQAFLIRPQEVTYYAAAETDPWEYIWVAFDGTEAERLLHKYGMETGYVFRFRDETGARQVLEQLYAASRGSGSRAEELRGWFYLLFANFAPALRPETVNFEQSYFARAEQYIRTNYSYDMRISDLARYVGIDRTYLYRIFLRCAKLPPKQYLLRCRTAAAGEMLANTELNVTEVALSCGFHDSSSFCREFRRCNGCTPLAYRRSHTHKET
jgi:AraC-like DNA-binding protein